MSGLPEKIVVLHDSFASAGIPHAFGGALALAWCTQRARGTIDIDVNLFTTVDHTNEVLHAIPDGVRWSDDDRDLLERDGQARLWWATTPVDVFLSTTEFHDRAGDRAVWHDFIGTDLPFLSCADLAVFQAFFNRTKDWADLEEMQAIGALDLDRVIGVLVRHLGIDDERIDRRRALG